MAADGRLGACPVRVAGCGKLAAVKVKVATRAKKRKAGKRKH